MLYEKIYLREDRQDVYLECYCYHESEKSKSILVIPGGGYGFVSDREGEPIAKVFGEKGFNCFVLQYSINENSVYPNPLLDAALAMKHIRQNADKYHVLTDKVFAVGFSAGGHLCGMLGNMWYRDEISALAQTTPDVIRPTGVMLIYPVITAFSHTHQGTIDHITGGDHSEEALLNISIEKHISSKSVPAFLVHTAADATVDVENAIFAASAYSQAKVPFEMHIFPFGPHGLALGNSVTSGNNPIMEDTEFAKWPELATAWINRF